MRQLISKCRAVFGLRAEPGASQGALLSEIDAKLQPSPLDIVYLLAGCAVVSTAVAALPICVALLEIRDFDNALIGAGFATHVAVVATCIYMIWRLLRGHRLSAQNLADEELKLDTAINSMHQGLVMFDKDARAVVIN